MQTLNTQLRYVSYVLFVGGLFTYLYYRLRCVLLSELRKRYDFVSIYEIPVLQIVFALFVYAVLVYINTLFGYTKWVYFSMGVIVIVLFGVLAVYVANNFLKLYYPFYLEKKLRSLRFQPRRSQRGKIMRLLSEEEEDEHLNEGMQAEENLFSVDYDVWIDEHSGDTKIERYDGKLYVEKCPSCGYLTLKIRAEHFLEKHGKRTGVIKYYTCRYCGYSLSKTISSKRGSRREVISDEGAVDNEA